MLDQRLELQVLHDSVILYCTTAVSSWATMEIQFHTILIIAELLYYDSVIGGKIT